MKKTITYIVALGILATMVGCGSAKETGGTSGTSVPSGTIAPSGTSVPSSTTAPSSTSAPSSESNSDAFSDKDISIVSTKDKELKVSYGDSRADVEKKLGTGTEGRFSLVDYESGASIWYRDDKVVGFMLDDESDFTTPNGVEVGMKKSKVEKLYGKQFLQTESDRSLDYVYDKSKSEWVTDPSEVKKAEMDNYLHINVSFDEDQVNRILLGDERVASLGN